jgi:hypothetical protein
MTTTYNHEAIELALYVDNDYELYQLLPQYTATLDKHWQRGRFDKARALVLLERFVQECAKKYHKEHGSPQDKWYSVFTPVIRREVAEQLLDEYIDRMVGA